MGINSGDKGKKFALAATKRGRFNANPTRCNHAGCSISQKSKLDKKNSETAPRIFKFFRSSLCSK